MTAHVCEGCGMLHDMPTQTDSDAYRIALLEKETAIELAKINARADKAVAETYAEADVEVAESHAEALTEILVGDDTPEESEPSEDVSEPIVIDAPIIDSGNDIDETAPPTHDEHEGEDQADEEKPKKAKGLGLW